MFYTPDIDTLHELPQEEAAHCSRVLRKEEGDRITLTDGKGHFFEATITAASSKRVLFQIDTEE
ncbi:MAG TPA: 16S rRNA (uracil(1498)-N(3))-methyltransferase, partial [Bacteroidaceae bacterium]|nr:16S rRNA (uracil(1498)-N(3))-methyltransferase [Bacteroidaceae bacterium]